VEPAGVADFVEEPKRLDHAVLSTVFEKFLVIFGDADNKDNCRDFLEAVDPFLTFITLPAHVEKPERKIRVGELGLHDAGGTNARAQNVLAVGDILGLADAIDGGKVVGGRVVEVELRGTGVDLLNAGIGPQRGDPTTKVLDVSILDRLCQELVRGLLRDLGTQRNVEVLSVLQKGLHRRDDVAEHGGAEHGRLLLGVGCLVEELHLLHDRGLAGLARAEQQELHFEV